MMDTILFLGPVVFRDFEIPARIPFGGVQRLAVHPLLGGGKVIDALGRDDGRIAFSGTFTGADATLRARLLDELRVAGATLPLSWDVFFYTVVIHRFQAQFETSAWIPFRVECEVVRDEASALVETALSLGESIGSDLMAATPFAGAAGIDMTSSAVATDPGAAQFGTIANLAARSLLASTTAAIEQGLAAAEAVVAADPVAAAASPGALVAALTSASTSAGQAANLAAARGYVGRAAINLSNAST